MSDPAHKPFLPGLFVLPAGGEGSGRLIGTRCGACGKTFFPVRSWCPLCHGTALERVNLSSRGTLYTYTICRMPLPHLEAPYAIGWVDLPGGVRVFSLLDVDVGAGRPTPPERLRRPDAPPLRIGMDMELTFGKLRGGEDGAEEWTYKFKPVEAQA